MSLWDTPQSKPGVRVIFGLQTTPLCHHIIIGDESKGDQCLVQTNNGINNHIKIMTYLFE